MHVAKAQNAKATTVLFVIFVVASAIGLHVLTWQSGTSWEYGDVYTYFNAAENLFTPEGYALDRYLVNLNLDGGQSVVPPAYPALVRFVGLITGDLLIAAKIINIASCLIIPLISFFYFKGKIQPRLNTTISIIILFGAYFYFFKNSVLADLPYTATILGILLLTANYSAIHSLYKLSALIALSVLFLHTKITGVYIIPFIVLMALVGKIELKHALITLLCIGLSFVILQDYNGYFATYLDTGQTNQNIETNQRGLLSVAVSRATHIASNLIPLTSSAKNPALVKTALNGINLGLFALVTIGLVRSVVRYKTLSELELYFISYIAMLLLIPSRMVSIRILLPLMPLFWLIAFREVEYWSNRFTSKNNHSLSNTAIATVATAVLLNNWFMFKSPTPRVYTTDQDLITALEFVESEVSANQVLLTKRPRGVAYFTGKYASDYHFRSYNNEFLDWSNGMNASHIMFVTKKSNTPYLTAETQAEKFCAQQCNWQEVFVSTNVRIYNFGE